MFRALRFASLKWKTITKNKDSTKPAIKILFIGFISRVWKQRYFLSFTAYLALRFPLPLWRQDLRSPSTNTPESSLSRQSCSSGRVSFFRKSRIRIRLWLYASRPENYQWRVHRKKRIPITFLWAVYQHWKSYCFLMLQDRNWMGLSTSIASMLHILNH